MVTAEPVRFLSGLVVANNGLRTSVQRRRAAMAGDEHAPVHLCLHHRYQLKWVIE